MLLTYLMEFIAKGITLYIVQSLSPGNKMLYLSPSIFNAKIYSLNLIELQLTKVILFIFYKRNL